MRGLFGLLLPNIHDSITFCGKPLHLAAGSNGLALRTANQKVGGSKPTLSRGDLISQALKISEEVKKVFRLALVHSNMICNTRNYDSLYIR